MTTSIPRSSWDQGDVADWGEPPPLVLPYEGDPMCHAPDCPLKKMNGSGNGNGNGNDSGNGNGEPSSWRPYPYRELPR